MIGPSPPTPEVPQSKPRAVSRPTVVCTVMFLLDGLFWTWAVTDDVTTWANLEWEEGEEVNMVALRTEHEISWDYMHSDRLRMVNGSNSRSIFVPQLNWSFLQIDWHTVSHILQISANNESTYKFTNVYSLPWGKWGPVHCHYSQSPRTFSSSPPVVLSL